MTSPLPTIPEKDRDSSLVGEQDNQNTSTSSLKHALTKTPRKILHIATLKSQDQPSYAAHCSSEKSPTTPSSFAPTLHTNDDQPSGTHHTSKEIPDQNIGESPTVSTFSRAPTIDESNRQSSVTNPVNDSERPASRTAEGHFPDSTSRTFQFVHSIRWRGVLAMIAGVFAQMMCWGLIMAYGTVLCFVSRLRGSG